VAVAIERAAAIAGEPGKSARAVQKGKVEADARATSSSSSRAPPAAVVAATGAIVVGWCLCVARDQEYMGVCVFATSPSVGTRR
jgi:hypothetical protein